MLDRLTALRAVIAEKLLDGPSDDQSPEEFHRCVSQFQEEREQVERGLSLRLPQMSLDARLRAVDADSVARVLPPGSALVEFVHYEQFNLRPGLDRQADGSWAVRERWLGGRYLAFVLHAGRPDSLRMIDLGDAASIDELIRLFREEITQALDWPSSGRCPQTPSAGDALRERVFDPVLPVLAECTRLVVLSACETGLGLVLPGEGVFGLRKAFVEAGARSLVMSLWKVPDESSMALMGDFYSLLLQGVGVAEALREAQLMLKRRHQEPVHWAAFICQGDPGAVLLTPPAGD